VHGRLPFPTGALLATSPDQVRGRLCGSHLRCQLRCSRPFPTGAVTRLEPGDAGLAPPNQPIACLIRKHAIHGVQISDLFEGSKIGASRRLKAQESWHCVHACTHQPGNDKSGLRADYPQIGGIHGLVGGSHTIGNGAQGFGSGSAAPPTTDSIST
jgi:hypothetical protein